MSDIDAIRGSDGSANASLMTIQSVRSPSATTIVVDTVAGVNEDGFYGSMGTPHTFTDPITEETITVISEATAVDFKGHVESGHLEIDEIAPGYTDADGSAVGDIVVIRPTTQWSDNLADVAQDLKEASTKFADKFADFVEQGGALWAQTTGLVGGMSAGFVWFEGERYAVAAITSHTFGGSKDTYIDIDPTTGTPTYIPVTNGAAEPALTANNVRIAKVVSGASAITSVAQEAYDSPVTPALLAQVPWIPWVPVWTGTTIGNAVVIGRYQKIGKIVHFKIDITVGSSTALGVGTDTTFTLPIAAVPGLSDVSPIGDIVSLHSGVIQIGNVLAYSAAAALMTAYRIISNTVVGQAWDTANVAWSAGDTVGISGTYEAA